MLIVSIKVFFFDFLLLVDFFFVKIVFDVEVIVVLKIR